MKSYIKFVGLIAFIITYALSISTAMSQEIIITKHDESTYPNSKLSLLLIDANHRVIPEPSQSNIKLTELDGSACNITKFTLDNVKKEDFALTIAFDMAIGTAGDATRFDDAIYLTAQLIRAATDKNIDCALTAFDHLSYLHQPYTQNQDSLANALSFIKQSQTSFMSAPFGISPVSALEIAKTDKESAILIITDSYDEINATEIIAKAKANNTKIYVLQLAHDISASMKELALQTGGYYFDNLDTKKYSPETLGGIAYALVSGVKDVSIEYTNNYACNHEHIITAKYTPFSGKEANIEFTDTSDKLPTLVTNTSEDKPYIGFSAVKPGQEKTIQVDITAKNGPIKIDDVYIITGDAVNIPEHSDILKITSSNHPSTLIDGATFTVKVKYHPADSVMLYTKLVIKSDACIGKEIFITAGYPSVAPKEKATIRLIEPKEGDYFFVGDTASVMWEGLLPEDMVHLALLYDEDGKTKRIDSLSKVYGKYDVNTPAIVQKWALNQGVLDSCRLELIQWWPNKIGETTSLEHAGAVNTAYFSNDNLSSKIVTASSDSTIAIWDSGSAAQLKQIAAHKGAVNYAEFSHDDKYILSASDDKTVKIWDAKTYKLVNTFTMDAAVKMAKFSLHDNYIVASDMGANVKVWNINDSTTPVYSKSITAAGFTYNVKSLDIHPTRDGLFMFSCYNSSVYFDDFLNPTADYLKIMPIKQELGKNSSNGKNIVDVPYCKFNEAGDMFAVISEPVSIDGKGIDKNVSLWSFSPTTYSYSNIVNIDTTVCGYAKSTHFKSDPVLGNMLIISNARNNIFIWDIDNKREHKEFENNQAEHTQDVTSCVFNFDSWIMLTASLDSTAKIWYRKNISVQVDTSDYFAIGLPEVASQGINFGYCASQFKNDTLATAFIQNLSGKEIRISNVALSDNDDNSFAILDAEKLNQGFTLQINETKNIALRYAPTAKGDHSCNIEFQYDNNIPKSYFDAGTVPKKFAFTIDGSGFIKEIDNKLSILDFGEIEREEAFSIGYDVFIENKAPNDIIIDKIDLTGFAKNEFVIQESGIAAFPYTLAAGGLLPIRVAFTPKEFGKKSAQIYYSSNGQFNPVPINLFGVGSPIVSDSMIIKVNDISGAAGEEIEVPIYLDAPSLDKTLEKIEGFTGYLKFNRTLLSPVGEFEVDSTDGDWRIIKIDLPKEADANGILRTLTFEVGLGNDTISPLALENFTPLGLAKIRIHEKSAQFNLTGYCAEGDLPRLFDQNGRIFLAQNMPNPFAEKTIFTFEIVEKGNTKLSISSYDGKEITTLIDAELEPGVHECTFSREGLAPGTYFYTLTTPTQHHTKSFIIEN